MTLRDVDLQAKEHVRRLQQQEAEPSDPVEQNPYSDNENGGGGARDKWDCESVLTSRSTLYNHPQKLDGGHPRYTCLLYASALCIFSRSSSSVSIFKECVLKQH